MGTQNVPVFSIKESTKKQTNTLPSQHIQQTQITPSTQQQQKCLGNLPSP
jgi:phage antirepressor YoqD-like protein